jgi:hypothetical protein
MMVFPTNMQMGPVFGDVRLNRLTMSVGQAPLKTNNG